MSGVKKGITVQDRFLRGCQLVESGCIEWQGWRNQYGYGCFRAEGRDQLVHRWAYQQKHGELAKGVNVCHACDNPRCVNVEHPFAGTQKENIQDASRKGRVNKTIKVRGEAHHHSTANEHVVREVRRRFELGQPQIEIAHDMEITKDLVFQIVHRITWRHIL